MTVPALQQLLLVSALTNYVMLLIWFLAFSLAHDRLYRLHGRWFNLSPETFDGIHYIGMSIYKIGIILLNLTPYLALHIIS